MVNRLVEWQACDLILQPADASLYLLVPSSPPLRLYVLGLELRGCRRSMTSFQVDACAGQIDVASPAQITHSGISTRRDTQATPTVSVSSAMAVLWWLRYHECRFDTRL